MGVWLFALPGLILLAGAGFELYARLRRPTRIRYDRKRRTPWQEVSAPPGERRWRSLLPFTNAHPKDQGLLLDVSGEVRWLLGQERASHGLSGHLSLILQSPDGRRDGYFAAGTVEPSDTLWVEVVVAARGTPADLEHLVAGAVTIRYRVYTRNSDERHEANLILSAAALGYQPATSQEGGATLRPIPTHLLTEDDDLAELVGRYTRHLAGPGDVVVIAESAVAIVQGRYYSPDELQPGWLATRLCHFFPLKGSLGTRYTLQALMNEHGAWRVGLAMLVGLVGKAVGVRGLFYRLAGEQARLIDDLSGTLPPFDKFVVLGPNDPAAAVREIEARTGLAAAIVDANDIHEAFVLAASPGVDVKRLTRLMRFNPHGNDNQQTPLVLVSPAGEEAEQVA